MARKSKSARIKKLIHEIEGLPFSEIPEASTQNFYPFSNEKGLETIVDGLNKQPKKLPKATIRVGILTGESSFPSLLHSLAKHCNLITFNDKHPLLIRHIKLILSLLLLKNTPEEFEKAYDEQKGNLFDNLEINEAVQDLGMRKKALGHLHFLHSKENYLKAQAAARKLFFAFGHSNLFHEQDRKAFFQCFTKRNCQIIFFNATNLYEWDANTPLAHTHKLTDWHPKNNIEKIFKNLPFDLYIMASLRQNKVEFCALKTHLFSNFRDYLKANQRVAHHILSHPTQNYNLDLLMADSPPAKYFTPYYKQYGHLCQNQRRSDNTPTRCHYSYRAPYRYGYG